MLTNPPPWPNGARCAVAFTFDVDTDSALHHGFPSTAHRKVTALSWARYDQVAIPRILDLYRRYDLRQTFFVPGWVAERYPDTVKSIADHGHDVALHGYIHELSSEISLEEEAAVLERGIGILEQVTGRRPIGWRAPSYSFSPATADLLCQAGFVYDSSLMGDEIPYLLRSDSGELIEFPADFQSDDWPQYVQSPEFEYMMPIRPPARAMEVFRAEVEAAYAYGGLWVSIWHPFVSGRLSRAIEVARLIEDLVDRGDVWIASLKDMAMHIRSTIEKGTYAPRVEKVPYYGEPVPEGPAPGPDEVARPMADPNS